MEGETLPAVTKDCSRSAHFEHSQAITENGHRIVIHISIKMRMPFIKILPGNQVALELSPYDVTRGRMSHRAK
jgi:translation initiation factor IF-1